MPSVTLLIGLVLAVAVGALLVAVYLLKWVLSKDMGPPEMRKISNAIKQGAEAFLARQNKTIILIAGVIGALIFVLYAFVRGHHDFDPTKTAMELALWTALSFVLGAGCSVAAGYVGMWIAIRSNIRTASAARTSLNDALRIALRGGAVSGLFVVAMSLLGVAGLFFLVYLVKTQGLAEGSPEYYEFVKKIPYIIVGYGFGASLVALFAQVGGGIYTKAADVGADLVGKVEAGIPEDDPRNPAVIADLVGDNVGDCAGRGADLFESTAAENIGAMILGVALFPYFGVAGIMFPLVARSFGLIASIVGIFSVKTEEDADPMDALNRGYYVTCALAMAGFVASSWWLLRVPGGAMAGADRAWMYFSACGAIGILMSLVFLFITQYYTEYKYAPVLSIVKASKTGPATNIIQGMAVGFECTMPPTLAISVAVLASYKLGQAALPGLNPVSAGLFGTAVATMGMLGPAGFVLAMDTFGPITDNAGGIVEMSKQPEAIRHKTDRLDAVGNTTKALTKGYAIGSAALAAFLLFSAYLDEVKNITGMNEYVKIDLVEPELFIAALLGTMVVFYFTSLCIQAVGATAQSVILAVREQFKKHPGIMKGTEDPNYGEVVDIVTRQALKEMVLPGVVVLASTVAVGLVFRGLADRPELQLGARAVAAFLMAATIGGILVATLLNNAGGAWDNAKKYVELGGEGADGKGSDQHKAAVCGDTVGDPFKDTAGPSLHVLIK
ncbi:MAG: sodium-translocating pyrophosphatase, partial [Candidatus Methylomirabilis sp.]|nr:sodium-translocating pyrophosphatase [Deltaproteobacteria bacterium]